MNGTGGGRYATAEALARVAKDHWQGDGLPYIVCTGGEPLLQLDKQLIDALHAVGFEIAIETNGTIPVPPDVDWVCVSPKSGSKCVVDVADELKLVYPQEGQSPEDFDFVTATHRLIQPLDDQNATENLRRAAEYCLSHPTWQLSIQMHKIWGIR
jgi:organic radical activating enzyme